MPGPVTGSSDLLDLKQTSDETGLAVLASILSSQLCFQLIFRDVNFCHKYNTNCMIYLIFMVTM